MNEFVKKEVVQRNNFRNGIAQFFSYLFSPLEIIDESNTNKSESESSNTNKSESESSNTNKSESESSKNIRRKSKKLCWR